MNADELAKCPEPQMAKLRRKAGAVILLGFAVFLGVLIVLLSWQTKFPLSPQYTLRISDASRLPISGVLVVHEWGLSVMEHGEDKAFTDANGVARFEPTAVPMSMLRRLSIKVLPSARGLGYENYSSARCRVYLPGGMAINLTDGQWSQVRGVGMMYTNSRGMFIRIIDRSQRLVAQAARVAQLRPPPLPPPNSPQADHVDLFFPRGVNDFELHVHSERPT